MIELPDGSGFTTGSYPLPRDHWLYAEGHEPPPMPLRMGKSKARALVAEAIRDAARYAVRGATRNGQEVDFDPDAIVQNMVVGLVGYFTEDGTSGDEWDNPKEIPPEFELDGETRRYVENHYDQA